MHSLVIGMRMLPLNCKNGEGPRIPLYICIVWFFPSMNHQPNALNFSLINNNNNNGDNKYCEFQNESNLISSKFMHKKTNHNIFIFQKKT